MAEGALESYLRRLDRGLDRALPAINRRATMASRVRRSFSMRRCADMIGVSYAYLVSDTGERITVEERGDIRSTEGDRVGLTVDPGRVMVFDDATGMRMR